MIVPLPHPVLLMRKAGLSEIPAATVISVVAILQYVFLGRLWIGYLIEKAGDVIAYEVVATATVLALAGTLSIGVVTGTRWVSAANAARKLEKDANNPSFDDIKRVLAGVLPRSTLAVAPRLRYTPKNDLALETRQGLYGDDPTIVVGLAQRFVASDRPDEFSPQIGHEVSHLELSGTGIEVVVRRAVALHFLVLGWFLSMFLLALGFIDRTGLGSDPPFSSFNPIFDATIYITLSSQFIVLLLSSLVVFAYPYFYVVRREHAHDVRGSQLAGNDALATKVFPALLAKQTFWEDCKTLWTLHPTIRSRIKIVERRDVLLLSPIVYPLLVATLQPLLLLLTTGWRVYFGVDESFWNLGLTVFSGLLLYLALSADFVRLGLGLHLEKRRVWWFLLYALVAAVATQIPRIFLEIAFGLRRGFSGEEITIRILSGLGTGGFNIIMELTGLLVVLGYLSAAKIAAFGFSGSWRLEVWNRICAAVIVVAGFTIISLSSIEFQMHVLLVATMVGLLALAPIVFARCSNCRRSAWQGLMLQTKCRCGGDRLRPLRDILEHSYACQAAE
ncbi:hypothetical protein I6F11_27330 [Ensifer sp. NBAIM29]|nr:hypothetical protein [Ensifer sp. NBAIM29]